MSGRTVKIAFTLAATLTLAGCGSDIVRVELDPEVRLLRDDLPAAEKNGQALSARPCWGAGRWTPDVPLLPPLLTPVPRQAATVLVESATIGLHLSPEERVLEGEAVFNLRVQSEVLDRLSFDLSAAAVTQAACPPGSCTFTFTGEVLEITLPAPLSPGESIEVQISWNDAQIERTVDFTPEGGGLVLANLLSGNSTFFTFGYRFWPVPRAASDGADIDFEVTYPAEQSLLMSGEKLSDSPNQDGTRTAVWNITWWTGRAVALALGEYVSASGSCGEKDLEIYALPGQSGDGYPIRPEAYRPVLEELCQHYAGRFGEMPPGVIRFAGVDERFVNGYSTPGLILVPNYTFDDDGTGSFIERDFYLAHELSHQWWGLSVLLGSVSDLWLVEGMADYVSATALEILRGSETGRYIWLWEAEPLVEFFAAGGQDHPLVFSPGQDIEYRVPYIKGAWVLRMLQDAAGTGVLEASLAEISRGFHGRPLRTGDFVDLLAARSGKDLSWFFEQWLYGTGLLSLSEVHAADGGQLELTVTQRRGWSADPQRFFRTLLQVRVHDGAAVRDFPLELTEPEQVFSLDIGR